MREYGYERGEKGETKSKREISRKRVETTGNETWRKEKNDEGKEIVGKEVEKRS